MGTPGRLLPTTLALLVALAAAAPGHAQDTEGCPYSKQKLSQEKFVREILPAHRKWLDNGGQRDSAVPGRAVLCEADLRRAPLRGVQLQGANLLGVQLQGAILDGAQLQEANLREADLRGASLYNAQLRSADLTDAYLQALPDRQTTLQIANLEGARLVDANLNGTKLTAANLDEADLRGATLNGADLSRASISGAQLSFTDLTGANYAPRGLPDNYLEGIKGLATVSAEDRYGRTGLAVSGLVQLRELLQRAGLRDREREATYAIERNKTHHALTHWQQQPLAALEGVFRLVAFEWPVGYGLYPGFALQLLLGFILAFSVPYMVALVNPLTREAGIWRVWAADRVLKLRGQDEPERLEDDWYGDPWWRALYCVPLRALQFSILSAFHIGFREFNVGTWLARLQTREYTLRATGWVRAVAGLQSLLSVYLLALWALTYFGRPFQ